MGQLRRRAGGRLLKELGRNLEAARARRKRGSDEDNGHDY